jgi:hypothetical protein
MKRATSIARILSRFTLRFSSDEVESAFMVDWGRSSLRMVRTVLVLAGALYSMFGILDTWITPEAVHTIWSIRGAVCTVIIIGYGLTFHHIYLRGMQVILLVEGMVIGLGIVAMVAVADAEGGYHYYAGLLLVIPYVHGLMRLRFVNAVLINVTVLAAYGAVVFGLKSTPAYLLVNNLFFLISASILGMFTSYALELGWRRVFWQKEKLEKKRNLIQAESRRKTLDLEAARRLQLGILPQTVPLHPLVEFAASMCTASEVGGDYYDFVQSDDGSVFLVIGDATGHGAQAGAMVAATKLFFTGVNGTENLVEVLDRASVALSHVGKSRLFMALGLLRFRDGMLEVAGAGMPPALLYREKGRMVEQLSLKGVPLGSPLRHPHESRILSLEPGDTLLLMSDGLPELRNLGGEELGYDRLSKVFREIGGQTPERIIEILHNTSREWRTKRSLHDDITCIVMKVKQSF